MEVLGLARIDAFDVYLPLLFPQISANPVPQVRTPGTTVQRALRVTGIDTTQRNAMAPQRVRDSSTGLDAGDGQRPGVRIDQRR